MPDDVNRKGDVFVYAGKGSSNESVKQALFTLRRLLSPIYAVSSITGEQLVKDNWASNCALIVIPGGADLGYCDVLNGVGNRKIHLFLEGGGAYMGFCAGGYYGSSRVEFEVGDKKLEVVGRRELAFFPGICRGCAFKGFKYGSEDGARAAELKVNKSCCPQGAPPDVFRSYYNGGGAFVDAPKLRDKGIEVLASYTEQLDIDPGEGAAAVIYCPVGRGAAILTGPHPEFASRNVAHKSEPPSPEVIDTLIDNDTLRNNFMKGCLRKLNMKVNWEDNSIPTLSLLHLSSSPSREESGDLLNLFEDIIVVKNTGDSQGHFIEDDNDTFRVEDLPELFESSLEGLSDGTKEDEILDLRTIVKRLHPHRDGPPSSVQTPYFNHLEYFRRLQEYERRTPDVDRTWGQMLLYGEVVTSTNTLLEKNTQILRRVPAGFTACATRQVQGRGRGSNVWVSPLGSLMFSVVIHHPMSLLSRAPMVFIQYLAALAVVEGINSYSKGYEKLPVKLKWPNDIYALDPSAPKPTDMKTSPPASSYVKIGGILVNSHYTSSTYHSVVGIGLNTTNEYPTTSLSALVSAFSETLPSPTRLEPLTMERLLASLVSKFSAFYTRFCTTGFDSYFEGIYYKHWLHSDQVVTLETEGGRRARIKGITKDGGCLVAEEILGGDGFTRERAGRRVELQSDGNSFDFFKGLIMRKVS